MNRRFLPLLMVLLLLFSTLTGCAESGDFSGAQGGELNGGQESGSGQNGSGGQSLSPEEQKLQKAVDPSSVFLPDLRDFLYVRPGIDESYYSDGHQFQWMDSIPIVACDDVEAELLSLLSQPRYQLELVESFLDPHYSDQLQRYLYRYTGTNEAITLLPEKYGEYEFHVRLTIKRYVGKNYDREYFRITFEFNENFQLEDPGIRTSRDITYLWAGGTGAVITKAPDSGQSLSPEEQKLQTAVDPSSVFLPDIRDFLYILPSTDKNYYADGHQFQWNGSIPIVAYEDVEKELTALLAQPRYQLELTDSFTDPHYGNNMQRYVYRYTGTNEAITLLPEKYEEYEFHVRLTLSRYTAPDYDPEYFKITLEFNENFQLEDPGIRTSRDITFLRDGGTGAVITKAPDSGNGSGSGSNEKEWCTPCGGSGNCSKCGGDGETKKFQAGLGYVSQRCTSCGGRGDCKYCHGDGER